MVKHYPNLKVSKNDKNKYKALELDNQLMVYLIQNPLAEKAAAALACHVGSLRDPREYQGLAHFLEHMLFVGSEKYPGEGEFSLFLGQNGGSSNAYTTDYVTNYHFEVRDDKLLEVLDMFAQFFICPLFKEESALKEINAVNSEAEMYYNDDEWRLENLNSLICDQASEVSKYLVGNLDTLGDLRSHIENMKKKKTEEKEGGDEEDEAEEEESNDHGEEETSNEEENEDETEELDEEGLTKRRKLVQALKDFHQRYYSANQMVLCVYTKGDLDNLEKEIIKIFTPIENKKIQYLNFKNDIQPFPKETLCKFLKVIPINKGHSLKFLFRLKEYQDDMFKKSGDHVAHLIGHESTGSILDLLAKEGLALSLMCSFDNFEDFYSTFSIDVELTQKGYTKENMKKVIAAVGAYISMLRNTDSAWVYEEQQIQNNLKFEYQDTQGGIDYCTEIAETYMGYQDKEGVLYSAYEQRSFDKTVVADILANLKAENLHLIFMSDSLKEADVSQTDPIYKTRYQVEDLRKDAIDHFREGDLSWSSVTDRIRLPDRNTFLPKNFDLKPLPPAKADAPNLILETDFSTVWHWQDHLYKLPKAIGSVNIYLEPGKTLNSCITSQMLYIWKLILEDNLRSLSYMAEMAKVDSSITLTKRGFVIRVDCFNESLQTYFTEMMNALVRFYREGFEEEKFKNYKNKCELELTESRNEAPYQFALNSVTHFLQDYVYSIDECLEALKHIEFEDQVEFCKGIFNQVRFEWLVEGNITAEEAITISNLVEYRFTEDLKGKVLPKDKVSRNRCAQLNADILPVIELESSVSTDKNSGFLMIYQLANTDEVVPALNFIKNWLETPYFEELRTQQQLGYVVSSMNKNVQGVRHFYFLIQSDVKTSHYCVERTHEFIAQKWKDLEDMDEAKFKEIQAGTLALEREPFKTLGEKFSCDWHEIKNHQFKFNRKEWTCNRIEKLTKEDILTIFKSTFIDKPKMLEIHIYSQVTKLDSIAHRKERKAKNDKMKVFFGAQEFKNTCDFHVDKCSKL